MAELFLEEGRRELPVDGDYTAWRQAQQRRLGEARERWLRTLADATPLVPAADRWHTCVRISWMSTTPATRRIRSIYRSLRG